MNGSPPVVTPFSLSFFAAKKEGEMELRDLAWAFAEIALLLGGILVGAFTGHLILCFVMIFAGVMLFLVYTAVAK